MTAKILLGSTCKSISILENKQHPLCSSWKAHVQEPVSVLTRVQLFDTPWTLAQQAPLPMELSRQEYQSGLPFSSPAASS